MPGGEGERGGGGNTAVAVSLTTAAPTRLSLENSQGNASSVLSPSNSSSKQEPARAPPAPDGGQGRTRRSSSVVVYPEKEDVGKPKVFARQSFIVSGEEEEMAETILQARAIAGQRRRSTFEAADNSVEEGAIAVVAKTLAARRDSLLEGGDAAAATAAASVPDATATVDPEEQAAGARRRSSVLNRIPDNLRALVQQSDKGGVQQKTESPHPQSQQQAATGTVDAESTEKRRRSDDPSHHESHVHFGWLHKVFAFVRWKGMSRRRKSGSSGIGSGGRKESNSRCTPKSSPFPGYHQKSLLPTQLPKFAGRKQLILDLDETLVHSSFKPIPGPDYIMDIEVDNTFYKVFVLKRPGVDEFLERVSSKYEVIIFTASLPQYANPLLDLLDPKGYITARLFREQCTFHEGYFVKDLTLLRNQTLETTIIVDNSPMAYMFQPENAIDCISWIDEQDDMELYVIADFLDAILDVPDVRDLLEFWREGGGVLNSAN